MSFASVTAQLRDVRWGQANEWDDKALSLLHDYYRRLVPIWPPDRAALPPTDRVIEAASIGALTDDDRARIANITEALWSEAKARNERVEASTKKLASFVLAWAVTVDAGRVTAAEDPGAPLLELFAAGFQINYTHSGIELHYASGWNTAPVPRRSMFSAPT